MSCNGHTESYAAGHGRWNPEGNEFCVLKARPQ